jgi:pimeloyl-ACP methyl ester carboxylesterase
MSAFVLALTLVRAAAVTPGVVTSTDGVRVAYDSRGEGQTALVFIHCWACDRSFWREQLDVFADRYRVVSLDLAGHGASKGDRARWTVWTVVGLADDVRAVADALDLRRIILIGHSMGGPVALRAADLLTGRVLGVVAIDTLHDAEVRMTPAMVDPLVAQLRSDFAKGIKGFVTAMFPKGADPKLPAWVIEKALAANRKAVLALFADFVNIDLRTLFMKARVPVRAINASPPISPKTEVATNRKYAEFVATVIAGAGHYVQLERPREVNERLTAIFGELAARKP